MYSHLDPTSDLGLASPQFLPTSPLDGARVVAGDVALRHLLLLLIGLRGAGDPVEAVGEHRHCRLYLVDESLEKFLSLL